MNVILALGGLPAFLVVMAYLVRLVARDGLGTNASVRSHREELGSWIDQDLRR